MIDPKLSIVDISMKEFFFDRSKVLAHTGKVNARRLSRAGAFIRRRAMTKILQRRKGTSQPGRPPNVHAKSGSFASLKTILFHLDATDESVVIGPVKLNQREHQSGSFTTVPQRLEFGGIGLIHEERFYGSGRWRRRDWRRRVNPNKEYRVRRARYAKRPFMGPALQAEVNAGTIIGLFASVG
jgi:hypothetical protein